LTEGLDYLHSRGVIHGDLRPVRVSFDTLSFSLVFTQRQQNILVNAEGNACITDFGLATVTRGNGATEHGYPSARSHNSLWAAPETLNDAHTSKEADIFSYGLVVVEVRPLDRRFSHADLAVQIWTGESPWGQVSAVQVMTKIALGELPVRPEGAKAPDLTTKLWDALTMCWHANPGDRITISEILKLLRFT